MYWFIYGLIIGAGSMRLGTLILEGSITIPWYAWVTGIITFLLLTLVLQTFFASYEEREPKAARMALIFLGVPTLVLGVITVGAVS